MKTRIISGAILVVLLIATLGLGGLVTAGVLLFVSIIGYRELAGALGVREKDEVASLPELVGLLAVCAHYLIIVTIGANMTLFVAEIMALFVLEAAVFVFNYPKYKSHKLISSVFSFIYAPMMLSFIYLLRQFPTGKYLAWLPFVAWICDTFAYFSGVAFGKHKLCPVLSPKKTIEGAVGGVIGSVLAGVLFGYVYATFADPGMNVQRAVISFAVITLVAGIISQIGDLIASGIKRDNDIKDYGNLIPGHGGIMDRFDSVIFITPAIYFLSLLFLK